MSAPWLQRDYSLARLTTVRTGGRADYFARPRNEEALVQLLALAAEEDIPVAVVGSGSNLLVADEGFRGLAIKLKDDLTTIERDGERADLANLANLVICGGGARLPSVAAKVAAWGLAGLEFGVNIPGTVGGAVRMNANAYGGELGEVLEWVSICTASGCERRSPEELGFEYRNSGLEAGEVVSRACFHLHPADAAQIKAAMAAMRERRHEAQPSGIKTFGSTFKNPDPEVSGGRTAGQLLAEAGCNGIGVGGARFAEKHANFVENTGKATTADILATMAQGRRRVHERFGVVLEPEVQVLGEVEWPADWELSS